MLFYILRHHFCNPYESAFLEEGWLNRSSLPYVTECGQHIDLSIYPTLFLILFSPIVLYELHKSRNAHLRSCSPISLRIIICCLLLVDLTFTLMYDFFVHFNSTNDRVQPHIIGDFSQYLGACIAMTLSIACRNRGISSSGVLFNYWLLIVLCGFPEARLLYAQIDDPNVADGVRTLLYAIYYFFSCLQLFLSCFADTPSSGFNGKNSCPELASSFLNKITFHWFTGLAILGNKKPLEREDLWDLNERDKASNLLPDYMDNLSLQIREYHEAVRQNPSLVGNPKIHPSVVIPVFQTYKLSFLAGAAYKLIFDLLQFVAPALLRQLIDFIQDKNRPMWTGLMIAALMFLSALLQSMLLHQYFHEMFRLGMNIRSVLTSAVYKKALNLSNEARKNRTTGSIVNLMSVDIQRLQDMTTFIMLFWSSPLQILLSIYFLWNLLGWSVIAGFVILLLMIPLNSWISIKMRNCQMEQMKHKDERIKMVSEVLNGMKVLKLYAWEKSMEKMVLEIREKELEILRKLAYLNAATTLSWACAPFLVAVLTFGLYVIWDPENNILTPQITFVALALFNILRFPLAVFAMVFSQAVQCVVSIGRLNEFFASEEMENQKSVGYAGSDNSVKMADCSFTWGNEDEKTLNNINFQVKRGQLVAIVGRVGSGKSSLLQALLSEMNKTKGVVEMSGSVAYVPQQAWIQNLSLRNNILFNKPMDPEFYDKVVFSCALNQDLASLPAGDLTEIGEKGINLSGGQKQRVSLARAVYSNADIVLLDDPLSAVDAHVGKHIFEHVISSTNGILARKTRILVTHGLTHLKFCDQIIVVKDGTISEMGTYKNLMNSKGAFSEFLEEFLIEESKQRGRSVSFGENAEEVNEILSDLDRVSPHRRQRIESQMSQEIDREAQRPKSSDEHQSARNENIAGTGDIPNGAYTGGEKEEKQALLQQEPTAKKTPPTAAAQKLIEKETIETGKVKLGIYLTYFKAIGFPIVLLFVLVYIASSILGVYSNLYLAKWSDDAEDIVRKSNGSMTETQVRLGIYAGLGMGQAISVCAASMIMALGMVRASRLLHFNLLDNIMHSPMAFFDVTPLGRIINRFGKDVEALDHTLPMSIRSMAMTMFNVVATLFVILWATPAALFAFLALSVVYMVVLRFYVSTSRQLKRLESASRSPIYSHFQESIQGASSIRAYGAVEKFVTESQNRVDENLATYYPSIVANRWLAVRLELVGNMIVLAAALFAVLFRDSPGLSAGLVGLSVSYALNITQTLNWAVRMTSELETNIVAVERIQEYTDTPTEDKKYTETVPANWPPKGEISIVNYSVRYRAGLDLVLHDVTAHVEAQEKIGIVGRTGAGKSSLTLALFRIIEADGGFIEIDGTNIANLQLEQLRSRLTIVPQDPVLFSGTLRVNLDPFNTFNDDQIWTVLRNAHLESFVLSLPDRLAHQIVEEGTNLSVGQRQLICLARALLRRTKILILDEAAAAVDVETDSLLQKTIREQFRECTVLTIAHRLNTVMDSDRLLVLDKGSVAEFDTPSNLLANPNSIFYSMARDARIV